MRIPEEVPHIASKLSTDGSANNKPQQERTTGNSAVKFLKPMVSPGPREITAITIFTSFTPGKHKPIKVKTFGLLKMKTKKCAPN